jgi:hypothetical protein
MAQEELVEGIGGPFEEVYSERFIMTGSERY